MAESNNSDMNLSSTQEAEKVEEGTVEEPEPVPSSSGTNQESLDTPNDLIRDDTDTHDAAEVVGPEETLRLVDNRREQVVLVNRLIKTINRLRNENTLLELRISDSDQQNKILQLQIDIMMKKMDLLEGFMSQVKRMDEDAENTEETQKPTQSLCQKCKKHINRKNEKEQSLENSDDDDSVAQDVIKYLESLNSEEDDGNGSFQNPLMIDIILSNVLSYLPVNMLLKCRLVNRFWNQEASFVLRNRNMLALTISNSNIERLPKLMEVLQPTSSLEMSSLGEFLFRNVKIDVGFLVKTYREIIESFLKEYGPQINHYTLHCEQENSSILYTEEVRNLFLPFITNIHSLELSVPTKITERQTIYDDIRPKKLIYEHLTKLKLRQMDVNLDIGGYSVSIVKELLNLGPRLRSLTIETHTKEVVTRILLAFNDKECRAITNQLEELYLDAFVTEEHLRLLLPLDFRLSALQLSYFTVEVTTSMLEALLTKHRTTLRKLILGDYQKRTTANSLPLIIKLPPLKELRQLKFVDPLFPDHRQIILNPLNYSEQLPNLQELSFEHESGKPVGPHYFQDMFVCSPSSCPTLQSLKITHGLVEPHLVVSAAKMFPNLRKLELAHAPDALIQVIWREFCGIKALHLHLNPANLNIDSLMTGIPDQVCRRIQEKNLFSQVDLMNALDIIRTEASICHLTELETLKIDGFTSSLMTAVTGYLALCHMPNLSNISIKSDTITLSRECRRVLGETLHLNLLEFF